MSTAQVTPLTGREIESRLRALEDEKNGLVYAWLEAQGKKGNWHSWDYEEGQRATKGRRREILDEQKRLRDLRKKVLETARRNREKTARERKASREAQRAEITAECQICENRQCLHHGCLVHHGYRRPGDGQIWGDCPGVGYLPYPAADALLVYETGLEGRLRDLEDSLRDLPQRLEILERRHDAHGRLVLEVLHCGVTAPLIWERAYRSLEDTLRAEERRAETELSRVRARIAAAKGVA